MGSIHYITASCLISNHLVYKNESVVFRGEAAGISHFLNSVYQFFNFSYPKFFKMDHLSKLGWIATEILLSNGVSAASYPAGDVGVVMSNTNASLDTDKRYFDTVKTMASPALFVYTLPNMMIGEICIRNHFKGENAFFVSDDFDIPFIREYVSNLLELNVMQACLCGWVDLMGEEYKAAVYFVEKSTGTNNLPEEGEGNESAPPALVRGFTNENIEKIYHSQHG